MPDHDQDLARCTDVHMCVAFPEGIAIITINVNLKSDHIWIQADSISHRIRKASEGEVKRVKIRPVRFARLAQLHPSLCESPYCCAYAPYRGTWSAQMQTSDVGPCEQAASDELCSADHRSGTLYPLLSILCVRVHAPREVWGLHSDRLAHFGPFERTILFECMRHFLAPELTARKHMGNVQDATEYLCRYYNEGNCILLQEACMRACCRTEHVLT